MRRRSILLVSAILVAVAVVLVVLITSTAADAAAEKNSKKSAKQPPPQQQQQQPPRRQQRHSITEVTTYRPTGTSNAIAPDPSSMANAFAAKPHGVKHENSQPTAIAATTSTESSTENTAVSATTDGADASRGRRKQQPQNSGKIPLVGMYLQPSADFSELFAQLGRGNMTAIAALHQLAVKRGDGHAMMLLGVLYGAGVGVPRNDVRAKLFHTFAAQAGIAESIVVLAMEEEMNGNCDAAVEYAKQAADISARFNSDGTITPRWDASRLTQLELKQATSTESEFDVQLLLAERGNAPACCTAGYAYMLGLNGVDQDGATAKLYFERGMDLGEAACFSGMGQLYARGVAGGANPVARDPKLAAKYYRLGAEKNHAPSLNGLGFLYASGALSDVGERDFETAAKYFEQSAQLNNAPGTYNSGLLYLNGKGVIQDSNKAMQKFQRAASMGSLLATYQLANMFAVGVQPIPRSCSVALGHFNQVQRLGPWNLRWNMARAALYASPSAQQHDHPKLHQQQQQQQQQQQSTERVVSTTATAAASAPESMLPRHTQPNNNNDDGGDGEGGSSASPSSAGIRLPASPGEALLHYLILGAMARPKASQNAMFVIERFFGADHPLVSFNGTVGSRRWRDETLANLAEDEAQRRIKMSQLLQQRTLDFTEKKLLQQQQQYHEEETAELLQAIAHEITTGSYRNVILHRLVREAARHGSADAKLDLASHYWDGIGTPRSHAKAREAYRAAANEGSVEAMWTLGWLHSTTEEEQEQYFLDSAPGPAVAEAIAATLVDIRDRVNVMTEEIARLAAAKDNANRIAASSSSSSSSSASDDGSGSVTQQQQQQRGQQAAANNKRTSSSNSNKAAAGTTSPLSQPETSFSNFDRKKKDERRRRRITGLPGSAPATGTASAAGVGSGGLDSLYPNRNGAGSMDSSSSLSSSPEQRHKRDIHRAKHYYDQVAQMFPSAWFAVRLALLRLNFLWWHDHFFAPVASSGAFSSSSSSSAQVPSSSSSSTAAQSPTRKNDYNNKADDDAFEATTTTITPRAEAQEGGASQKKLTIGMSLRAAYKLTRKTGLEVLRLLDPTVAWGLTVSEILTLVCIVVLVALLLIKHHAFGM